jgi:HEAT repeat protein
MKGSNMSRGEIPGGIFVLSLCAALFCCSPKTAYVSQLSSADAAERAFAVEQLGLMEHGAVKATASLIEIIRKDPDTEVRRLAVDALGNIQPPLTAEVTDAFVLALNDRDVHIRRAGVIAVGKFSNFPPNIITMLQKHLNDPDNLVRELVMCTFERIGVLGLHTLLRALKDPDDQMRLYAIVALGRLGGYATPARPQLQEMQYNDSNGDIRRAAEEVLRVITQ